MKLLKKVQLFSSLAIAGSASAFYLLLPLDPLLVVLVCMFALMLNVVLCVYFFSGIQKQLESLETGLLNFRDAEFGVNLTVNGDDELSQLARLYNETSEKLRLEKQWIYQRELMLDKVLQSSPLAVLLVDDHDKILFANTSAREMLYQGNRLEGSEFSALLQHLPASLRTAVSSQQDGLFTLQSNEQEEQSETWHLSHGRFLMNGQRHRLLLFKQLTREISRQEVQIWKKVIRVISHELNNSLAPILSMVHSGKLLSARLTEPRLETIFNTISERAEHLSSFIQGYARFAKLPTPNKQAVEWHAMLAGLQHQWTFAIQGALPDQPGYFDQAQLEQVLINLLKNATESGSLPTEIALSVRQVGKGQLLEVVDRGQGMSETVLTQALLPFYSTKASGSGLGLALCREIVEAHDGWINLSNREGGGLNVSLYLPA